MALIDHGASEPDTRWFASLWLAGGLATADRRSEPNGSGQSIAGCVTVDGVPLLLGLISFCHVDAPRGPVVAGSVRGGRYHIDSGDGPAPGWHIVAIESIGVGQHCGGCLDPLDCRHRACVATEGSRRSELRVFIQAGANQHDFSVTHPSAHHAGT